MDVKFSAILAAFFLSFGLNVFLLIKLKNQKTKTKLSLTQDAKDLLSNILQGQALVDIRVLDPSSIILRSPR